MWLLASADELILTEARRGEFGGVAVLRGKVLGGRLSSGHGLSE